MLLLWNTRSSCELGLAGEVGYYPQLDPRWLLVLSTLYLLIYCYNKDWDAASLFSISSSEIEQYYRAWYCLVQQEIPTECH